MCWLTLRQILPTPWTSVGRLFTVLVEPVHEVAHGTYHIVVCSENHLLEACNLGQAQWHVLLGESL